MKITLFFLFALLSLLLNSCSSPRSIQPGTYSTVEEGETLNDYTASSPAVLAAGDEVEIAVWRNDELNQSLKLDINGNVYLVLGGEIHAEGMTVEELQAEVSLRLKKYYKNPLVSITTVKFVSQEYYTLGEINTTGKQLLDRKISAFEAIISAGGLTDDADDFLLLIRKEEKAIRIIKSSFDLTSVKDGGFNAHELIIAKGDIIYIPSSRISDIKKAASTVSTILAPIIDIERMLVLWPSVVDALEDRGEVTVSF